MLENTFKGDYPYLRITIPWIIGILIGLMVDYSHSLLIISSCLFLGLLLLIIVLNSYYVKWSLYNNRKIVSVFLLLFLSVGALYSVQERLFFEQNLSNHFSKNLYARAILGKVIDEPSPKKHSWRCKIKVSNTIDINGKKRPASGYLLLSIQTDSTKQYLPQYGDVLLLPALYKDVSPPLNQGEFDYKNYLHHQHINQQMYILANQYKIVNKWEGNLLISFAYNLRKRLVEKYSYYINDKNAAAIASTLILGYKATLDESIIQTYANTGTIHILSVSGMHLGILYILLNFCFRWLDKSTKGKYLKLVLSILSIWFYALLTGFSSAVCRASVMISFFVLGKNINKNAHPLNILSLSAFALLLYNPMYATDVGFQLSYLAMLGLFVVTPLIQRLYNASTFISNQVWSIITGSIGATISTFPISIFYFHQFPVYFLFSNIIIALPAFVFMIFGIMLLFPLPEICLHTIAYILEHSIIITNHLLHCLETLPFSVLNNMEISTFQYVGMYIFIATVFGLCVSKYKQRWLWMSLCSLLLLSSFYSFKSIEQQSQRYLVFYGLKRGIALSIINGKDAVTYAHLGDDKSLTFSIEPQLRYLGVNQNTKIGLDSVYKNVFCEKRGAFLQGFEKRIMLWDAKTDTLGSTKTIKVDYLVISKSRKKMSEILKRVDTKMVLLSANMSKREIALKSKECKQIGAVYRILKNEKGFVVQL